MNKWKCTISYDGTNFFGSQVQPEKRTVQGELERALQKMHNGKNIRIYASGRTDSGVHAKAQTIHFSSPLDIEAENWKRALNSLLLDDIYVHEVERVADDFHAQYDAVEKEYRYFVLNQKERDVFKRNYAYYYPYPLDLDLMKEACTYFEGTHDFTSFCAARSTVKGSKVRTLYEVKVEHCDHMITFIVRGNGFLYKMVRNIVGTLLDVGSGKLKPAQIEEILQAKDRTKAGKTAPANGLFLWQVVYGEK